MPTVRSQPVHDEEDMLARARVRRMRAAVVIRRRQIVCALELLGSGQGPSGGKQREEHAFSWSAHVLRLTEAEFKLRYRLDFDSFTELVRLLRTDLTG